MAAEVNSRECSSVGEEKHGLGKFNRSSKNVRAGRVRSEQVQKSVKYEEGDGMRTSVLQGKVKALKEKHMKGVKQETKVVECLGGESGNAEDALVIPQLRTYLTEELLDCSKQKRLSDAQCDSWRADEFWDTYSSGGSSVLSCSGYKTANLANHCQDTDSSSVKSQDRMSSSSDNPVDVSHCASKQDSGSLTLAEKVERNRQKLRSRFDSHSGSVTHNEELDQKPKDKDESWIFAHNVDGDPVASLPVTEDCGELSVRHEQAKQLLQRARMKAKGASPLRASHCVLPNPHSQQPTHHRGPSYSGVLTDGGSLSDSSSSDHCSWHKGSRGSSPSHVRFQDESEREAEERYRERLQVPQTSPVIATPPRKRQSNGLVSWTEQLSPSAPGQCGTCGSYLKGQVANPAAIHGTNLRNVHLGSKITQDGSASSPLGVKPSPHWILPSQPWRVHSELIRETHIGGDSTPDSSGDDDGHQTHKNKYRDPRLHKHCRSNTAHTAPEQGGRVNPSYVCSENTIKEGNSNSNQHNGSKNGTSINILENRVNHMETSETTPGMDNAVRRNCVDSIRTVSRKLPESNTTQKHKKSTPGADLNPSNPEIGIGSIMLNMDATDGKIPVDSTDGRTPVMPSVVSSHGLSGHMPVPPSGKAPTMVQSRSRFTLRSGVVIQQLNSSHDGEMVQICLENKNIEPNPVPNLGNSTQETGGSLKNFELFSEGTKSKELKSRPHKSKKHSDDRNTKDSKENRDSKKHHLSKEQRDIGGPYTSSRQKDFDKHPSSRDQRVKVCGPSDLSREQEYSEMYFPKRDDKCSKRSETNRQLTGSNTLNTGYGKYSRDNSFTCQTTSPINSTKDGSLERGQEGSLQPAIKKGDLRSGMRKIFSSIGLASRPKMERFHSTSLEQISSTNQHGRSASADGDNESYDGLLQTGKIKKSPSLQSLKLMSPFHLPRKASSVQNLTGKSDRSAVYITDVSTAPRRALSVEDIGSPGEARVLGKVAEVFPDGTRLLELQRPDDGTFGFRISSVGGRPDSGIYLQEMSDANTAKLYSGLLRVGDEILEVNGTKVSTLGQSRLNELMNREPVLSLRVLHQRRTQC